MASKTRATTTTEVVDDLELDELGEDVPVDDLDDTPDNVIALRDPADLPAPVDTDTRKPLTTGQKVGVGVGISGATGLAAWGLYKLGQRLGWWGVSPLIIDDADADKGSGSKPKRDDPKPSPSPSNSRMRALGNPPNVSGDPQGYNTQRYPHPGAVRLTMTALGYKVAYSAETLVPNNQPHPEVRRFQREWNKVIRGLDLGRVKFPEPVDDPSKLKFFRGVLSDDGIPGKNTLNAMEIAVNNQLKNKMPWRNLVGQA